MQEKMNDTTLEQQTQEQGKEEPGIVLNENGELEIRDDALFEGLDIPDDEKEVKVEVPVAKDKEEEMSDTEEAAEENVEETETAETKEETTEQEQEQETKAEEKKSPKDYPDTITEDGVTKYKVVVQGEVQYVTLDELRKGYQRQSDYTRKTQALSQEKKQLEEEKRKVQELLKSVELQANYRLTADEMQNVINQADEIVKKEYGLEEYDENYETVKQTVVTELANQIKRQKEAQEKFMRVEEYLKSKDPDYEAISQLALQIMENELPLAKVRELERAKANGDPMPFLELYRTAAERFRKQQQPKQKAQAKGEGLFTQQTQQQAQPQEKQVEPPVVERPTNYHEDMNKPKQVPIDAFARGTIEDQAKLLIELGLV